MRPAVVVGTCFVVAATIIFGIEAIFQPRDNDFGRAMATPVPALGDVAIPEGDTGPGTIITLSQTLVTPIPESAVASMPPAPFVTPIPETMPVVHGTPTSPPIVSFDGRPGPALPADDTPTPVPPPAQPARTSQRALALSARNTPLPAPTLNSRQALAAANADAGARYVTYLLKRADGDIDIQNIRSYQPDPHTTVVIADVANAYGISEEKFVLERRTDGFFVLSRDELQPDNGPALHSLTPLPPPYPTHPPY